MILLIDIDLSIGFLMSDFIDWSGWTISCQIHQFVLAILIL